jgi:ABC-type sugar transport system ATPase subunit
MRRLARQYLDDMKVNLPSVDAEVESLSGGQRQAIAVGRATHQVLKVLLLDEPLAAMGAKESALIIDLVHDLGATGQVSMIVIDHNYAHLFELCHRVNVLQDGKVTHDKVVGDTSIEELTELMVSEYRRQVTTGRNQLAGQPAAVLP